MSALRGMYASPRLQVDRNVDDILCPPPPQNVRSSRGGSAQWKERHRGLLRRAQTLPTRKRIAALLLLGAAVAVLPWIVVRSFVVCSLAQPSLLCHYAWTAVNTFRVGGAGILLLAIIVLLWRRYWLSRLARDLGHLDASQRRLLGLPSHVLPAVGGRRAVKSTGTGNARGTGANGSRRGRGVSGGASGSSATDARKAQNQRPWSHAGSGLRPRTHAAAVAGSAGTGAGSSASGTGGIGTPGSHASMSSLRTPGGGMDAGLYGPAAASAGLLGGEGVTATPRAMYQQYSNPSRMSRLRGRQLGLEGGAFAIQDQRQLREYLREQSLRAEIMGSGASLGGAGMAAGAGGGVGAGATNGFGVVPYGGAGNTPTGLQPGASMYYEYAPGFSFDRSARASSIPGVSWDNLHQAEELLRKLSLTSEQVHAYTENLRRYLAKYLQDKVFKVFDWNVAQLVKRGFNREFLLGNQVMGSVPNNPLHGKMRLDEMIHRLADEVTRYVARTPTGDSVQLWKQRQELEEFWDLRRGGDKSYVMYRLRVLCRDGYFGHYHWNGGGTFKGRKWSAEQPSDAVLLFHVFTTMMDRRLKYFMPSEVQPFRNRYCHDGPSKPAKSKLARRTPILQLISTQPPHASVFAGGKSRPVVEGRENVFQAIILFLHYIKNDENDRLGSVDVRDLTRRVLTVQPGYYDALYFIHQD